MPFEKVWWVYMIVTDKGNLYTGISTDVERRWQEHCDVAQGKKNARGARFFRTQRPQKIVYLEQAGVHGDAARRERNLKALSREEKLKLADL